MLQPPTSLFRVIQQRRLLLQLCPQVFHGPLLQPSLQCQVRELHHDLGIVSLKPATWQRLKCLGNGCSHVRQGCRSRGRRWLRSGHLHRWCRGRRPRLCHRRFWHGGHLWLKPRLLAPVLLEPKLLDAALQLFYLPLQPLLLAVRLVQPLLHPRQAPVFLQLLLLERFGMAPKLFHLRLGSAGRDRGICRQLLISALSPRRAVASDGRLAGGAPPDLLPPLASRCLWHSRLVEQLLQQRIGHRGPQHVAVDALP
mmetsp:Transcript_73058/g.197602  ORF Transcript_73058/g.197602 Transcript_73058/m.197602 type:complete len:254 (-) Transcript_73058:575-1336(-)